jgi:cytochrome c oxidase cbb3-type subunit 3/ubiquinol-cytochrome c reductase cytochrome c subunit
MKRSLYIAWTLGALLACSGCSYVPGAPRESADGPRPDQQLDFHILYKQNCAGCHGENGRGGAAIALNNPPFLAIAGAQNLRTATAKGIAATMMPAFAQSSGGMLTDAQIDALVQGMLREWARPSEFSAALPAYASDTPGNSADGQKAYEAACARCHGADGTGIKTPSTTSTGQQIAAPHSIVDPSYLALVNDQSLRSVVLAGHLDWNAPDWRSYIPGHVLAPQEIADIVAWIASHRAPAAEQSINNPRTTPPNAATPEVSKKESQ